MSTDGIVVRSGGLFDLRAGTKSRSQGRHDSGAWTSSSTMTSGAAS